MAVTTALLLAACRGGGSEPPPAPVPTGFEVSDTAHWRFGYPTGWTTEETVGDDGEHILNVRGPTVARSARCSTHALWRDYPGQAFVQAGRASLGAYEPEQPLIVDQAFAAPGAREALRLEFIYPDRAPDGSVVRLHEHQLRILRNDGTAIEFAVTSPVGHEAECQAEKILATFTMKAAKG